MDIIDLHKDNYNIDKYVNRCCKMNLLDILEDTQKELERLNAVNLRSKMYQPYADMITTYKFSIQEIYELLNGAPIGSISERNKERIKPLLEHLKKKVE